jgi:hypothetical protein
MQRLGQPRRFPLRPRRRLLPLPHKKAPAPLLHHTESLAHVLGPTYDQGRTSAFGASYLHAWEWGNSYGGLGGDFWAGLGIDGRVVTHGFQRVDGGLTYAVARISGVGDAGGFGLELATGLGYGASTAPFPSAAPGVFLGLYYIEFGYSYQFPFPGFARPDWLSSHQFSLRINIPVYRYAKREWNEPPSRSSCARLDPARVR